MIRRFAFVVLTFVVLAITPGAGAAALRVFIRASEKTHGPGEHDYPQFLADWRKLLSDRGAKADGALRFPTAAELAKTDVLILYAADANNVAPEDRAGLEAFLQRGGGMVVLHDALCGTNAAWFASLAGGAKQHGVTNWQRGTVGLYFNRESHPITEGVANFDLEDEMFHHLQFAPDVKVLATTFRTAKEIIPQMWTHEHGGGRVFAWCQGHRLSMFALPHVRGLLLRAIAWAGGRPVDSLVNSEERLAFRYPAGGPSTPEQAIKKIRVEPTFDISIVASEPLTPKPISIDWDARGRMWVALTPEYPFKEDSAPGRDSIVILEDSNRDGRMDKRTVFADNLVLPTSFVFHRDGVIVSQAPKILFLRDTDGDGRADRRETLFEGFGTFDTHAVINNLRWGLDGWVYGCQGYSGNDSTNVVNAAGHSFGKIGNGIFRFRPDGSAIEQVASYSGNSWGIDFNWEGELFFSKANGPHISHVVMSERFLSRGKLGNTTADKSIEDHQKVNPIFGDTRHEYVQVAPVGVFTAASGCTIYEGGAWPEKYRGGAFVCEPTVHIVHEDVLYRGENPTYEATRRDESEFIAGRDLWFRPVHTRIGPDGAMYLLDFYNQAISHNDIRGVQHGPGNAAVRPDRDHEHGRIYRIQHKDIRRYDLPQLARANSQELLHALEHPNAWVRLTAQRLLSEKQDPSVVTGLQTLLRSNRLAYVRVHALWTLFALDAMTETNLLVAINDTHPSVVNNALRVIPELSAAPSSNVIHAVVKQTKDTAERTRLDALLALSVWPPRASTVEAVHKQFPDLKDGWTKSAVFELARLAPTNFIRLSFASDKADSFREIVGPLVEDFIQNRDDASAGWTLGHLGRTPGAADNLKLATLGTFNKHLDDHAPPFSTNIQASLDKLLKSDNRALRAAALPTAAYYEQSGEFTSDLGAIKAALIADLGNDKIKEEDRGALLTSLMNVESLRGDVIARVDALLAKSPGAGVQKSAITELGRVTDAAAGAALIRNFKKIAPEHRQLVLGTLLKRSSWALALCEALAKKSLIPADLGVSGASRLRTHPDRAVATRARVVFDALKLPQFHEKDALIARFHTALEGKADVKAGKDLFEKNCLICHKFGDKGKDLGPELTGVGLNGPTVLLTHILDPNRVVEGNFVAYNVTTRKNEEYSGLIKTENKENVVLKNLEGETDLRRADIASMRSSGLSLMPEGLEVLGEKGLRDIIGYLTANSPKGFRTLDMTGAFTADTRHGLFESDSDTPSLSFRQFGVVMVDNIPFNIVNPTTTLTGQNVTVLRGGSGFAKTLPRRVEFPAGMRAAKLYVLGGVAGWGFPYGPPEGHNVPAAKVTLYYADGTKEETVLRNGEQFADYVQPFEVRASKTAGDLLTSGQLRWFSIVPKGRGEITKVVLESFDNHLAPVFVAMTAQTE